MIRSSLGACAFLACAAAAQAAPVLSVTASYDPYFTDNTTISVTNTSGVSETGVSIVSGGVSQSLGTIAAGATASYVFNDLSGPFIVSPGSQGLPDTTAYAVDATFGGQAVATALFSAVSNLTGGYVDFLGACYRYSVGCSVDPTASYPLSAVVAVLDVTAAVPEPASFALLGGGLIAVAAYRRRASGS